MEATYWIKQGLWPIAGSGTAPIGLFGGGDTGSVSNVIDKIIIATANNAIDFGDLTVARSRFSALGSATRGVFCAGSPAYNVIDYATFATSGNAVDFGDTTYEVYDNACCSSSTRGLIGGGVAPGFPFVFYNTISYITIASTGNSSSFGNRTISGTPQGSCSSTTRGIFSGTGFVSIENVIDYVTIASTGNAIDFGDLTVSRYRGSACASATRGVFFGGIPSGGTTNVIDYVTIASTGNATDFGDLQAPATESTGAASSATVGVVGGQFSSFSNIQFITIATTGNSSNFGSLSVSRNSLAACSNAHGGI
jgi:hypothetical protein